MVASYLDLLVLEHGDKLDEDTREAIDFAVGGAVRMKGLIDGLLAFSRLDRPIGGWTTVEGASVWAQVVDNLELAIEDAGAEITVGELPVVRGNEVQLVQLVQNLVANALRFKKPDEPPRISVWAEDRDSEWLFAVRDSGIGLDPKHSERIFRIFQRLHPIGRYDGSGIGLAICRKIVERHGGRIWVEAEPDRGATFYFTISKKGH